MLSWIKQIVEAFGLPIILTLSATFLLWLRWRTVGEVLKDPDDVRFESYRMQLSESRWTTLYHQALQRWLLFPLVRWIKDEDEYGRNPGSFARQKFGIQPWTPKSYEFCLRLALIYPLVMMLMVWVLLGGVGQLGQWPLFPEVDLLTRIGVAAGILLALALRYGLRRPSDSHSGQLKFLAVAVAVAVVFGFVAVAAGAVAVAVAFVFVFVFVFAAVAVAVAVAVGAVAFAVAVAVAFDNTFALAFACILAIFIEITSESPAGKEDLKIWVLLIRFGYSVFLLIMIALALYWLPLEDFQVVFIVFLAALPLLNAFWDWLSLGISRGLLSAIVLGKQTGWHALGWALLDLVLAVVFLVAIVLTVTAALAMYNKLAFAGGHDAVVDLGVLFSGIREDPVNRSHYWVYAMFLSTLIPTFIHAVAASAAGIQAVSEFRPLKKWRQTAARQLERDAVGRAGAQLYLTFVPLLAIVVPIAFIYVLYLVIPAHGAPFGWWLLDISEATANWIGGVSPGPQ